MTKAVKWLLIANITVYILNMAFPLNSNLGLYYVFHPNFQFYQFITYMFIHHGSSHIFFNMFALWIFGRAIEPALGTKRFLIYYFVCGLGGAIVQELGQLTGIINPYAVTGGASGAVFGILLAFGMMFPNEKIYIWFILPLKAKYFVIGYGLIEIILGMTSHDGVAHSAHVAGMLFGFALLTYWKYEAKRKTNQYRTHAGWHTTSTHPNMKVTYNKNERTSDYEYNARKREENDEIDKILDKIRKNGYSSLTEDEKKRLFDASNK